jgi:hypothetical protein
LLSSSFKEFQWATRDSWSGQRRVVAKAEWTRGAANPRFVVTSLSREDAAPQRLYEEIYCARGAMENRIKECQLDLFADRTSAATMRANQLRLWFAAMAYGLLCAAPAGTCAHAIRQSHPPRQSSHHHCARQDSRRLQSATLTMSACSRRGSPSKPSTGMRNPR